MDTEPHAAGPDIGRMALSVVIPAYDEALRIGPTLVRINGYLKGRGAPFEIIVVDDGSRDNTKEVVANAMRTMPSIRLVENGINRGKGYSLRNGFLNSRGGLVLFCDADLSTPIEEVEPFIAEVGRGMDIVIGSRALSGSHIVKRQPLYRMLMGKTFNKFVRLFLIDGIADTQCGFKLLRRDTCGMIVSRLTVERFAYDVELLFLARKYGLRVAELPVMWMNSPDSKVHAVRDSANMFLDLMRVAWDNISGKYIVPQPIPIIEEEAQWTSGRVKKAA